MNFIAFAVFFMYNQRQILNFLFKNILKAEKQMNVFDFDKTIYDGDSTVDFWKFCLKKCPKAKKHLFHTAVNGTKFVFGFMEKTNFKEDFYRFLAEIYEPEKLLSEFWDIHQVKIKQWYLDMQKKDDVIISASPEFLLSPICKRLNIKYLMASRVDIKTGKYDGVNCHGEEKVRRYKEKFPHVQIHEFYSDSYSDTPLAKLAFDPILVKGNDFEPWSEKELKKK